MAELLANWLNNEVELSQVRFHSGLNMLSIQQVSNFEQDFANGYLFGELLYKFNQQSDFKEFSKKDTVPTKIQNFQKLEPTLRNLKIKFDSKMINGIMKQERGLSLRLLYQLKMALEKVYPPTDIAVLRKTGKMSDSQPAQKIAHSKEKYDQHAHVFFKNRLQELNKPQKQLNMENHLKKFNEEQERQEDIKKKVQSEEREAKDKMKQEIRKAQINKLQRNAGFMEEWLQKGVEDWQQNQEIKKERERKMLEFEYKQAEKYNKMTMNKINQADKEVNEGIEKFEQTLRTTYGIECKVRKEDAERAISQSLSGSPMKKTLQSQRLSQSLLSRATGLQQNTMGQLQGGQSMKTNAMTLTSTGLKTKDKKTLNDQTRKERERRRRKMIVDQNKTHQEMEQGKREEQIVERLKKQSKQEQELAYEQWRTEQCKNVIIEDRKLRDARYQKRRELDQQNENWREEEMLNQHKVQLKKDIQTLKERDTEMRISQKQAKRQEVTELGHQLFDAIFDIANEAYQHQQQNDTQEIDERNWKEWLQLFINDMPIDGTILQLSQNEETQKEELLKSNETLDNMELKDYLKNKGQWQNTLIKDNPINIEEMLTKQIDTGVPTGGKGGKGAPAKAAAEQIQLEEGDTELPEECPNNYILGDAVEQVININYEARKQNKRPKVPHFLNLKLCLVGYAFAGKQTQAQKLKEEYGLEVFYINELVNEALTFYENNPEIINNEIQHQQQNKQVEEIQNEEQQDLQEQQEKEEQEEEEVKEEEQQYNEEVQQKQSENDAAQQQTQQQEQKSESSELQEQLNSDEDFRKCGEEIKSLILEGNEVSDELYVKLIVSKLRMTFPHKDKHQLKQEIQDKLEKETELQNKLTEIENELNGESAQVSRRKKKNPDQLNEEADKIKEELSQVQQASKNGWVLVDFPSNYAQAKLLEQALSGYIPEQECEPIDREKQQQEAYLLVQPSPKESEPIVLMKSGLDSVVWFDLEREESMRRSLGRRYDKVNDIVYHVQDQPPQTTSAPLCERITPLNQEENSEATLIDRWMAFDNDRKSLSNWLNQFGIESQKLSILNKIDANKTQEETFNQIKEIINNLIGYKSQEENAIKEYIKEEIQKQKEEEEDKQRKLQEEEEEKKRLEEEGITQEQLSKPSMTKPEDTNEKIAPKQPSIENIDSDFKPIILEAWQELSKNYKSQAKKIFRQLRGQRERIISYFSSLSQQFLNFLHRPDTKQQKLETFINEFNKFSDEFPDLREDDGTKEELHQRVDILSDELWEITEERKEQEVEERKKIIESNYIENELGTFMQGAQQLMQNEVDKFKQSIQVIHDYYHAFEDKIIPDTPQQYTVDLVQEGEELPPIELLPDGQDSQNKESYQYPRLDLLYQRALKNQVVQDATQQQSAGQDKKAGGKGKDQKKAAVQEEDKTIEESQYVKDMKKAIQTEKAILRFRLTQVRNWTLIRLREMREKALKVYKKLDEWIYVATKAENEAVDEMCGVIKKAIEEETKIQEELRIKFMDFCIDEKIMNFIVPPPEKLPQLEQLQNNRFTIQQLNSVVKELENIQAQMNGQENIPNSLIVDLFMRRLENFKHIGDENGLPEEWKNFNEEKFQTIVRNLDRTNMGYINWKTLATYLCLLNSPIPNESDVESYKQNLGTKDQDIDLETFLSYLQAKAWFDEHELSQDREYSHPFPRIQNIKDLLFRINKEQREEEKEVINVKNILKQLKAKDFRMQRRGIKNYKDVLLSNIEK